jgi:hypothetical protein
MKKQILKTTALRFISKAALSLFLSAALVTGAQAQSKSTTSNEPVVKYVGMTEGKLVFQLEYIPEAKGNYTVEVRDAAGYSFYVNTCKDQSFQKRFAINAEEADNNTLVFAVSANGVEKKQAFDINTTARTVEEVKVSRAK